MSERCGSTNTTTGKPCGNAVAIYALRCPDSGEVRYVGKTSDPKRRLADHGCPSRQNKTPVAHWCRKLRSEGTRPVLEVLEWVPESDWEKAEKALISKYRDEGASLLNVSDGGLEMQHVQGHSARYPAYSWVMRYCARNGRRSLAKKIKAEAARVFETWGAEGKRAYDDHLRLVVKDVTPLARIPR